MVNEWWDISHEHRSTILKPGTLTCDAGHFVEFRKSSETMKSKKRKQSVSYLAKRLRALRKGFHDAYVEPHMAGAELDA